MNLNDTFFILFQPLSQFEATLYGNSGYDFSFFLNTNDFLSEEDDFVEYCGESSTGTELFCSFSKFLENYSYFSYPKDFFLQPILEKHNVAYDSALCIVDSNDSNNGGDIYIRTPKNVFYMVKFLSMYSFLIIISFFINYTMSDCFEIIDVNLLEEGVELLYFNNGLTKFHFSTFFILLNFILIAVLCFKNPKYYFRNWNIILFGMVDNFLTVTITQQLGIKRGQKYSVFIKTLFYLILFGNVFGLIPFSFTITSHLIYTFALSLSILVGITILALYLQGFGFFKLFVPSGAPVALLVLLVPIEVISYVARAFSLAIRLFANMMSGHTLLSILSGFVIKIANNGLLFLALAPLAVVMAVTVLEVGIACLQAYVFVVLVCIYLKDGFEAGH